MQRSKMHSVSIFLLLQGVIVRGKDGAAREEDLLKMKVSSLAGIAYASIISVLHMPREKININADHIILIFYIICAFDGIICPKQKQ